MAATDTVKPGKRKWFCWTVLLAFGFTECKLPEDIQQNFAVWLLLKQILGLMCGENYKELDSGSKKVKLIYVMVCTEAKDF